MTSEKIESLSPLAADVKAHSPDRYVATLFAPSKDRNALFALYAFDREIARVQTVVSEPMAGLIRLQWWDDVVDGLELGENVAHPVVLALQPAVAERRLDTVCLKRAIDGRRRSFEEGPAPDLDFCRRYLLDIGGSITCAAARLLGADRPEALALAERVGMVSALWEEMSASEGKVASPMTHLENWREQTASWALQEIKDARRRHVSIARAELAAFFPGSLAALRLRDPTRHLKGVPLSNAVPRLVWQWLRGRF